MKWTKRLLWIAVTLLLIAALFVGVFAIGIDRTNGKLISSGQEREYLLYVPDSYHPRNPAPLVISLHGYVEWPAHQMQLSGWNDLADEYGFIVVYPSGVDFPRRWRTSGRAEGEADPLIDVRFISDLIDRLEQDYTIDPARIYANGLSNGGGMSYLLGCTLSDRIAAVGSVAGAYLYPLDECAPVRPVPLIAFHGTADPIVAYAGGPSRSFDLPFPNLPDWMAAYAARNSCEPVLLSLPAQGSVSGVHYSGCGHDADVFFYTIEGGGHTWPGGQALPEWLVGITTQEIDATRVMWEFFQQHPIE